jgi:hypothetical protein
MTTAILEKTDVHSDLAAVRRQLDRLLFARLQPGWSGTLDANYRQLLAREAELLSALRSLRALRVTEAA